MRTNLPSINNRPPFPANIARNLTDFGTGQIATVTTVPQQVNTVNLHRSGIKLTNLSGIEIWYGNSPGQANPTSGDLVPAGRGQWIFVPTRSVIFVATASGTASMSWAEVYD